MTTNTRTEQRLLASIRKAKTADTATTPQPLAEEPPPHQPRDASTASTAGKSSKTSRGEAPGADPYQLGRRVWPD